MRFVRHKEGDFRTIYRFLLFPRTIGYETRWLEKVKIYQEFTERGGSYGVDNCWVDKKFIN